MSAVDLERALSELAALTSAAPGSSGGPAAGAGSLDHSRLARARRELLRVERAEFALLLRRAASLRLAGAARADETLTCGLREVLELALAEGRPWPRRLERLALCVATRPVSAWPGALRLVRAAHALAPCPASRALAAESLAAAGRLREALGGLARGLCALPRRARSTRLLECLERLLARAQLVEGDPELARICAQVQSALRAENAA